VIQLKTALGPVPNRWVVAPLRHCVELRNDRTRNDSDLGPPIGLEHVESWTGRLASRPDDDETKGQHSLFRQGDVLFGKLRPYLAKAHRAQHDGACSAELLVLRPRTIDAGYLTYCLLSPTWVSLIDSSTFGSKMPRANWEFIGHQVLPVPSMHEQRAIADFLDRETERIDALVAKKQRLIELLQEKRTALISHAVTRGLDPDTPLKNSSIAGIGRIPETWKPTRLWAVLSAPVTDGPHETPDFVDEGMPFLSVDAIQEGELVFTGCRFVSLADHTEFRRKAAPQRDDILMGKAASTGKIARVKTDVEFSIWSPLALIRLNHSLARSRYVEYALKAPLAQLQIDLLCTSNTQKNISMSDIPRVVIMLPPLREQDEIADRLDEETQAIDRLIGRVRLALERLGEHRSALITAAVTGQIDVGARKARRQAERP